MFVYDEIDSNDKQLLDEHLKSCNQCREELAELKKIKGSVSQSIIKIDNSLLISVRRDLRKAILDKRAKDNWLTSSLEKIRKYFSAELKPVLTGAIALVIGLGTGYLLFNQNNSADLQTQFTTSDYAMFSKTEMKISNVRFLDSDASDNEISFSFEAVKPMQIKGKLTDNFIQKILAHSLINEANDGVRLRTVNAISEQTEQKIIPDQQVKTALIEALKFDLNPGVRREALLVLKKLPYDDDIKEALLYVLSHDENAGLRVAAINTINSQILNNKNIDNEMLKILKQKIQTDENEYIQLRAKTILEEVIQNENL